MNPYDDMQNKLKEYRVPVDKDQLWAKTAHAIPNRNKRRGIILFLTGLAGASLLWFSGLIPIGTHATAANQTSGFSNDPRTIKSDNHTNESKSIPQEKPITSEEPTALAAKNNPSTTSTTASTVSTKSTRPVAAASTSQINHPKSESIATTHPNDKATVDKNPAGEESLNDKTNTPSSSLAHSISTLQTPTTEPSISPTNTSSGRSTTYENENPNLVASDIPSTMPMVSREQYNIDVLPSVESYSTLLPTIQKSQTNPTVTPSKARPHPIGLLFTQSYGWSSLRMTSTDPDLDALTEAWASQMTSLENLSTDMQLYHRWPNGWQVSTGLQYNRLATRLEVTNTRDEIYMENGITTIVIAEDGTIENLYGDVEVHRQIQSLNSYFSYHHTLNLEMMVQIPLIRHYRVELNAWAKGGYTLNYTSAGTTFDADLGWISYTRDENPYHLASPFNYSLGVGGQYRLTPTWTLIGRVGYQSLTYTHGGFDDHIRFRHSILDLGLGMGYTF